ncbi:MAG: serine/threonine-protein kinase [Planctomycetota bacterium]|nr:serine/threonine-protein kinase [Planctomycetota bacterium]
MSGDSPTRIVDPHDDGPRDPNDPLVGTKMGRWTLTRLIGRGGMGRVYEARGGLMNRRVALKVLSEDLAEDASFVKRFHREAKLLGSLTHPHIVDVIDRGLTNERLWFAMEFVRGESLRRLMDRGPVAADQAARIAGEIAGALSYAHQRGIVHRDLKPENVLLDEQGTVHLVDFGLSRLVDVAPDLASTRLTRTDVILGTYEYMSPEQRRGDRQLDGRADVFALGVILYEMLTGTLPLGRFTPPSQSQREIPRAFDDVVNKALATDRKDRYEDAGRFQDAIAEAREAAPDAPRPVTEAATVANVEPVVPTHDIDAARGVLRHAEILGAIDRVLGLLCVLGTFFGAIALVFTELIPYRWGAGFAGIVSFILGLYLMGLGRRVSRLEEGARESQVMLSVLLLFFPPFLTALGIYGLIVMTSDRARRAFRLGEKALREPQALVTQPSKPVFLSQPERPRPATLVMHAFTLLAIGWSLYAGLAALSVWNEPYSSAFASAETAFVWSVMATTWSLLVVLRMFLMRKQRRGFGLALWAFLFLSASTALLDAALEDARRPPEGLRFGAVHRLLPWSHVRRNHLQWEISK